MCPVCSSELDRATEAGSVDGDAPKSGDISVCLYCSSVLIFKDDLGIRLVKQEEIDGWDVEIKRLLGTVLIAAQGFQTRKGLTKDVG